MPSTPITAHARVGKGEAKIPRARKRQKKIASFPAFFSQRDPVRGICGGLPRGRVGADGMRGAAARPSQPRNIFRKGVDTSKKRD